VCGAAEPTPEVRRLGRKVHHSLPTNAEVKNGGAVTPRTTVPYIFDFFCLDFIMFYVEFYAITYQKLIYLTEKPITYNTLRYSEERARVV
jgi:hypothetical protein